MVLPSNRRVGFYLSLIAWISCQGLFFIPPGWPNQIQSIELPSKQGCYYLIQKGRAAILKGAYSDRFRRFPKMELIPIMKKRGIQRITHLVLTGHSPTEMGALEDLQKNFQIDELNYPPDTAFNMRRTFEKIRQPMRFKQIKNADKPFSFQATKSPDPLNPKDLDR